MKKLTLLFLLCPLFVIAQNQLLMPSGKTVPEVTGMLGIPFGKNKQECIDLMKQKGYSLDPEKTDYLSFNNVKYAGWTGTVATLYFYNGKFFHGIIIIPPSETARVFDDYERLIISLGEKYGVPEKIRDFKYPYKDGDGFERTAVESGYAKISDTWADLGPGKIFTSISKSLFLVAAYYHREEAKKMAEELKQERLKDL